MTNDRSQVAVQSPDESLIAEIIKFVEERIVIIGDLVPDVALKVGIWLESKDFRKPGLSL